jgi:uncharacterized DUF497 family protein
MRLRFEYDPVKSELNRQRHGIDFGKAQQLWGSNYFVFPAADVAAEQRYIALGEIAGKIFLAVFTQRGEAIRIITCHRASSRWERVYELYRKEKRNQT